MIHDGEAGWTEPTITINGVTLSFAEAMTLRVAVGNFQIFLAGETVQEELGDDLVEGYDRHLATIARLMLTALR